MTGKDTSRYEIAYFPEVSSKPQLRLTAPRHSQRTKAQTERLAILGVAVDNVTMTETLNIIEAYIRQGVFHQIATANVDFLNKATRDASLLDILRECDLVLADGMPLVWASKLLRSPLRERVTGADLIPRLLDLSAQKSYRVFLLGASPERSSAAHQRIERDYPGVIICGRCTPPFGPLETMDNESILAQISAARPDILLVAFGNPKQEKWIAAHRERLTAPVCIGVGACLDFLSGEQSRAPRWMQERGFEWLYRLGSEPQRLITRYSQNAVFLLRYLSIQLLACSMQGSTTNASASFTRSEGELVAKVKGGFTGSVIDTIQAELWATRNSRSLVLDMSETSFVGIDGAGWLLTTLGATKAAGRAMRLTSVSRPVMGALRATFPNGVPFTVS